VHRFEPHYRQTRKPDRTTLHSSSCIFLTRPVARMGTLPCTLANCFSCFYCAALGLGSLLVLIHKLGLERAKVQYSKQPVREEGEERIERDEGEQDAKVPKES
jgi:hypothetical protein